MSKGRKKRALGDTARLIPRRKNGRFLGWQVLDVRGVLREVHEDYWVRWRSLKKAADVYDLRVIRHDTNFAILEVYDKREG